MWEKIVDSIAQKGQKETQALNSQLTVLYAFTMVIVILVTGVMILLIK